MAKRFRKVMPLEKITDKLIEEFDNPALEQQRLAMMPARLFPKEVSERMEDLHIEGKTLFIKVKDPHWRKELTHQGAKILREFQIYYPELTWVKIHSPNGRHDNSKFHEK